MVVGKGDMLEWIAAWEEAGGESANLLPAVLTNPQVEVWGRYGKSGQLEGGLIAFRSPRVVGITNEFGSNEGLLEAVAAEGGQPICCYQRGERLARAIQRGFEVVGPLTVWLLDRS
ncbi:hypothetical protein QV13_14840 [Mesorhizobium hungaricum]|uniref:Uncharacterized protein n=2 Tax=Phyllobacteriaceae TaxID=69277 RepID=A0A1C2DMZ7_9HYPH|nr:hypothetical protein QV13_14840 [Mesorhizobium hungaricum]